MSLAVVFEYEVDPARAEGFEAVYGGDGEWALFRRGRRLSRHRDAARRGRALGRFETA
jgi:hypothetical protein